MESMRMSITRREFLQASAAGVGALATRPLLAQQQDSATRPNILFIMTDQQPSRTMGCYGNSLNPTPSLDRLARKGVRLTNFGISAFACGPSRACFWTGRYAHQTGVVRNEVILDASYPTLGTLCAQAGYDTAYFGKWHLGGQIYRSTPADHWYYRTRPTDEQFVFEKKEGGYGEDKAQAGFKDWAGGWKQYHDYLRSVGLGHLCGRGTDKVGGHFVAQSGMEGQHIYAQLPPEHHEVAYFSDRAQNYLRQNRKNPFCMVVSFYAPHPPVAPPQPWNNKYRLDQVQLPANHHDDFKHVSTERMRTYGKLPQNWSDKQYLDYIRRYYGYCAFIDSQVEQILDTLERTGQADNTIVVYTTDHGDMIASHRLIYKTLNGYDELLRVPFILYDPRSRASGRSADAMVSSIDVLPTLLDLAGITPPSELNGRSFRSVLKGQVDHFRDYLVCGSGDITLTIWNQEWKYVCHFGPSDRLDELYDLENDPGELNNLAYNSAYTPQRQDMHALLTSWLDETQHPQRDLIVQRMCSDTTAS